MDDIAELISELQELNLDPAELNLLVTTLTTEGLTESVRRKIRSVMMDAINKEAADIERYEKALDAIEERDVVVETAGKKTDQALNRINMQTKSELDTLGRKVSEDVDAAKGGATLLLHTEDVAGGQPSVAPVQDTTATPPSVVPAPVEMSPKQAAMAAMQPAPAASAPISPTTNPTLPSSPSLPGYSTNQPLPATMAPLPPTPIAPPAVTEPAAA